MRRSAVGVHRCFCTGVLVGGLAVLAVPLIGAERASIPNEHYVSADVAKECFPDKNVAELAVSAARGDLQHIDGLLSRGANPNTRGKNGMTPIVWAMQAKNKAAFKYLLDHGGRPDYYVETHSFMLPEMEGRSLIGIAARNSSDSDWLRTLLKHGANPNLVCPKWGDQGDVDFSAGTTPLFDAIDSGCIENVDLLIQAGADINHQDNFGNTPMIHGAMIGNFSMVLRLLEASADHRIRNNDGNYLAYFAAINEGPVDTKVETSREANKVIALLEQKGVDMGRARKKVSEERRRNHPRGGKSRL
jgi:uncharacterized protein